MAPTSRVKTKKTPGVPRSKVKKDDPVKIAPVAMEGWSGGLDIPLDRELADGTTLKDRLSKYTSQLLTLELYNQKERIADVVRWKRMYRGDRDERSFPFEDGANVAVPVSRSNADTIYVRLSSALWSKRKVWLLSAQTEDFVGIDRKVEDTLDWFQFNILKLKSKLKSPLLQCIKSGLGLAKIVYEDRPRSKVRYATKKELADPKVKKYSAKGTKRKLVKFAETMYSGPNIYPIDRVDWVISSEATSIQDAYMCGFQFTLRKPQIEARAKKWGDDPSIWYEDAVEDVLGKKKGADEDDPAGRSDDFSDEKKESAELEHKELKKTDLARPYRFWELWMHYDVDGDGREDSIVVYFHPTTQTIVKAIYNPVFAGFRPFIDFVFYPTEYSFDGEGVIEILEKMQIELDSLHNMRLDRLMEINSPMLFVQEGIGLDDFKLSPGKVTVIDNVSEEVIKEVAFHPVYPETVQAEMGLVQYMDRAVGVTADIMGISTAERPVARETFAHIQEANRKFAEGIENIRDKLVELGYMLIEVFAQYSPEYKYTIKEGGKFIDKEIEFPTQLIRDGLEIKLAASTELMNQEMRREVNLTLYQLMTDYYTKSAGMVQAILDPNVPPEFRKFLMGIVKKGDMRLEKILEDFDQKDAAEYRIGIDEIITEEQVDESAKQQRQMVQEQQRQMQEQQMMMPPGVEGQQGGVSGVM